MSAQHEQGLAPFKQRSAAQLIEAGVAFVEATVVRCAAPTSARPGDRAIVLGDGTIEGFVGGSCADSTVRLQALRVLETGEPLLLRIVPGERDGPSDEEGAVVVANPCLSGGALELFLQPHLPPPRVAVAGESPVARALAQLSEPLGFQARLGALAEPGDFAAVVASLGHGDEEAVRRGLEAGCEYVGLVASRVRGAAVLDALRAEGVGEDALARVRTPAGVAIGARTHAEIALSILAELVAARRSPVVAVARPCEAVDPVCGMTVAVGPDTPTVGDVAFCCEGCREAWLARTA
jgi:xanthine dehydrogenase accessory factor